MNKIYESLGHSSVDFVANPHLKLQIALTWTIDAITLLKNTIWLDTSALLDLDSTMMSDLFLSPKLQIPHRF
jgi:hypothetical protein